MDDPGISGPVWLPSLPPSFEQFFAVNLQPIPVLPVLALLLAAAYVAGAIRLWSQGRRWSPVRTLCFLLGCLVLLVITSLGIEGYGLKMFSVFVFQQLTLMMVIPPLLLLGSPGRLFLRAMPHRGLGRLMLRAGHAGLRSRIAKFALHPALVIPLMLLSLFGLYLTGVADALLRTWIGHVTLEIVFLAVGLLLSTPLISVDPLPRRTSYVTRMFDAFLEMQVHAAFGIVMILTASPLVLFFTSAPPGWGISPVTDQAVAGMLAWVYGEIPLLAILFVTFVRWQRQDARRTAREQKRADAELDDYNEYLQRLQNLPDTNKGRP